MHDQHQDHQHWHGPGCGHPAVGHDDHTDYVHDGHMHAEHQGHWDEHSAAGGGTGQKGGAFGGGQEAVSSTAFGTSQGTGGPASGSAQRTGRSTAFGSARPGDLGPADMPTGPADTGGD